MDKLRLKSIDWLSFMQEVQAIAQTGLSYGKDVYDKERYEQLLNLVTQHYAEVSGEEQAVIQKALSREVGYATPKICVRGLALSNEQVLLVKEREECLWSLPGGWTEVNLSPAESLMREIKEETGFDSKVTRLLAFFDKQKHDHPKHWPHTYIAFYEYEVTGGIMQTSHEISEIGYFDLDDLPPLSTHRVTEEQLKSLSELIKTGAPALYD